METGHWNDDWVVAHSPLGCQRKGCVMTMGEQVLCLQVNSCGCWARVPKAKTDCVSQDYLAENKELWMMDRKEVPLAEWQGSDQKWMQSLDYWYRAALCYIPLPSPSIFLLPNSSALQRKIIRDRAEVSLTPRKPHIPLRSWPANVTEGLKFQCSLGYRHRRAHSPISPHTQIQWVGVRAAFTVGKGKALTYGWGSLGPMQSPPVVASTSILRYRWTSPSCKSQRGLSQSGRVACRKVLAPLGLHSPKNQFRWQVSVTHDFTDWSLW